MAVLGEQTDAAIVRACQKAVLVLDQAITHPYALSQPDGIDISEARNRLLAVVDTSVANHIKNQIAF